MGSDTNWKKWKFLIIGDHLGPGVPCGLSLGRHHPLHFLRQAHVLDFNPSVQERKKIYLLTRDSVERQKYMSDQSVRGFFFCLSLQWTKIHLRTCIPHLSVARSRSAVNCFAIFSLGKSCMNTEFLKVKRGAMWHRSWYRTKDIYNLPLRKHFGEAVCSQDIPKWWDTKSTKFSQKKQ